MGRARLKHKSAQTRLQIMSNRPPVRRKGASWTSSLGRTRLCAHIGIYIDLTGACPGWTAEHSPTQTPRWRSTNPPLLKKGTMKTFSGSSGTRRNTPQNKYAAFHKAVRHRQGRRPPPVLARGLTGSTCHGKVHREESVLTGLISSTWQARSKGRH